MGDNTAIQWTDATWNPVTGCSKVSPGCAHCYAETMARRLQAMGSPRYKDGFAVRIHPEALEQPLHWRKPRHVFAVSMGDLFHDEVPEAFIRLVWAVMEEARRHTFQVLTKRPARMRDLLAGAWPMLPNVWLGVTAEDQPRADERVPILLETPAAVRFVSVEPMLGPVCVSDIPVSGGAILKPLVGLTWEQRPGLPGFTVNRPRGAKLDWVVVGGESGTRARPMSEDWVRHLRDQCKAAGTAFFYKQRMDRGRKVAMPELDGRTWCEYPATIG
jgi:protein gp37